jgi:hypothetical protein
MVLMAALCAFCQDAPAAEGPAVFQDGERVCFIGDSITHGAAYRADYHELIYLYYFNRFTGDRTDAAQVRAFFDEALVGMEGQSHQSYYKTHFENYMKNKPEEEKFRAEIAGLEKDLYRINPPQPRRYALTRAGDLLPSSVAETPAETQGLIVRTENPKT